MHSGTIVIKNWLGHKSNGFPITMSNILNDILEPFKGVTHHQKGIKADTNFILTTGRDFMVNDFNDNPDTF